MFILVGVQIEGQSWQRLGRVPAARMRDHGGVWGRGDVGGAWEEFCAINKTAWCSAALRKKIKLRLRFRMCPLEWSAVEVSGFARIS